MTMDESDDGEKDPEAAIIVAKLRKQAGGGKVGDDDQAKEADDGDAGEEALRSAGEDLFQAIRGRAPTSEESDRVFEAVKAVKNC